MTDLISRQAAIKYLMDNMNWYDEDGYESDEDYKRVCITELINGVPSAQPTAEPIRHGKWKWLSCTYDRVPREKEYECSECHHKTIVHGDDMPWEKYCPNCGARMDEE